MVFVEREPRGKPGGGRGKGKLRKVVCIANDETGVYEPHSLPEHAANKMLTRGKALEAVEGECPYEPAEVVEEPEA